VAIVVLLLLAATAGFVHRVTSGAPGKLRAGIPSVPHPVVQEMADCLSCHEVGGEGMSRSHQTYAVATCLTCHQVRLQP